MSCNLQGALVLYTHVNYPPELLQDTTVENMYLYLYLPSREAVITTAITQGKRKEKQQKKKQKKRSSDSHCNNIGYSWSEQKLELLLNSSYLAYCIFDQI